MLNATGMNFINNPIYGGYSQKNLLGALNEVGLSSSPFSGGTIGGAPVDYLGLDLGKSLGGFGGDILGLNMGGGQSYNKGNVLDDILGGMVNQSGNPLLQGSLLGQMSGYFNGNLGGSKTPVTTTPANNQPSQGLQSIIDQLQTMLGIKSDTSKPVADPDATVKTPIDTVGNEVIPEEKPTTQKPTTSEPIASAPGASDKAGVNWLAKNFDKYDANKDGTLNDTELKKASTDSGNKAVKIMAENKEVFMQVRSSDQDGDKGLKGISKVDMTNFNAWINNGDSFMGIARDLAGGDATWRDGGWAKAEGQAFLKKYGK